MNPNVHNEMIQNAFFKDALRPRSWEYIIALIVMLLVSAVVYSEFGSTTDIMSSLIPMQVVYIGILTVVALQRIARGGWANLVAPDILFVAFYTVVHLGYVGLYTIGAVRYADDVFFFPSAVPRALMITNLGLISFLLGIELAAPGSKAVANRKMPSMPSVNWEIVGTTFLIVGLVAHLIGLMQIGIGTIVYYGYAAIQDLDRYGTGTFMTQILITYGMQFIVLGVIVYCLVSAFRYGKLFHSNLMLVLVSLVFCLSVLEGDRDPIFKIGLPLIIIRQYMVRPIKLRYLLLILIASMPLLVAMRVARTVALNPTKMYQEYQYQKQDGGSEWYYAFAELGGSFNTLNITAEVVPESEPYWYGASWRDSAIHVVPFAQGALRRVGIGRDAPSNWVTNEFWGRDRAGRAFTFTGEGYLNFGYVGVFVQLFTLGAFMRWLCVRFCLSPSIVRGLVMFGCFAPVILVTRNHLNLLLTPVVHIFIGAWLLGKIAGRGERAQS